MYKNRAPGGRHNLCGSWVGLEAMRHLKQEETVKRIAAETESKAMRALEGIRCILNDDALDDMECYQRIAAILTALEESGIWQGSWGSGCGGPLRLLRG